ncbi:MAG TPA: T9SS type A sorting domain-containing protein [Sphingobacteriaceae bacterium]|nr:T9SS type A sorting domain-containing protein [Sphingobacteriaceae bacterium]
MKRFLRINMLAFTFCAFALFGGMVVYAAQGSTLGVNAWDQSASELAYTVSLPDTAVEVSATPNATATVSQQANNDPVQRNASNRTSRSFFSTWFLQPFRSVPAQENEKLVSNVRVFPSPVVETVNLTFRLGKRAEVSVKIMDALGNEMLSLLNQTMDAGTQNHSFEIQGKLSSGMYFVRVTAGTETVIKRISVL